MLRAAQSGTECGASDGGGRAMRRLRGCCACPLGEALNFALSGDGPHAMLFAASPGRARPTARPPMMEGRHWVDTAAEGGGRCRRADEALNGAAQRHRRVCDSCFPAWHWAAAGCNDGSDKSGAADEQSRRRCGRFHDLHARSRRRCGQQPPVGRRRPSGVRPLRAARRPRRFRRRRPAGMRFSGTDWS